jgi:hypothetical protein
VKLTQQVFGPDGELLSSDAWHLPNDLPGWLGSDPARLSWVSAMADLNLGTASYGFDQPRLEQRWTVERCMCVSCHLPAGRKP